MLFLLGLISSAFINTSIPALPYLTIGLIIFNNIQNYDRKVILRKQCLLSFLILYSITVFLLKVFISVLLYLDLVFPYNNIWYKTFGIGVKPHDKSAAGWLTTFLIEIGALVCEILLIFINQEIK